MLLILLKIIIVGFLVNLFYEILHSRLYETCLKMSWKKCFPLLVEMSLKDGFWISFFYYLTVLIFRNENILTNYIQLFSFVFLGLMFSYFDELVSVKNGRWEYSKNMPLVFGVGLTPFLEIALTGIITFFFVF